MILNEKYMDIVAALKPYSESNDLFIHFSDLPKLGINPQSDYNTPLGIYAYPLKEIYKEVTNDTVPFASERKWVILFSAHNIHDVSENAENGYTQANWLRDKEILFEKYLPEYKNYLRQQSVEGRLFITDENEKRMGNIALKIMMDDPLIPKFARNMAWAIAALKDGLNYDAMLKENMIKIETVKALEKLHSEYDEHEITFAEDQFKDFIKNCENFGRYTFPCGQLWNVTRTLARILKSNKNSKGPVIWNKIIRSLGYDGFTDKLGEGLIHENEPCQAVFFSTKPIKLLQILPNIRKKPMKYNISYKNGKKVIGYKD